MLQRLSRNWIALLLVLFACGASEFDLTLENGTSAPIDDAHVRFNGFTSLGGAFDSGIRKTQGGIIPSLPAEITVEWRNAEGKPYSRRITVPEDVRSASDVLVRINQDGSVTVASLSD
mgnify:CR=1 FL=1